MRSAPRARVSVAQRSGAQHAHRPGQSVNYRLRPKRLRAGRATNGCNAISRPMAGGNQAGAPVRSAPPSLGRSSWNECSANAGAGNPTRVLVQPTWPPPAWAPRRLQFRCLGRAARANVLRVRCRCTKEGSGTLGARTARRGVSSRAAFPSSLCRTGMGALGNGRGQGSLVREWQVLPGSQRLRCASWLSRQRHALVLPSFVVRRVEAPTGTPRSAGRCAGDDSASLWMHPANLQSAAAVCCHPSLLAAGRQCGCLASA
jgi:hypothetical protein